MKSLILSLLSLFLSLSLSAQDNELVEIIDGLNIEQDTIKAVYDWITHNIAYDVKKFKIIGAGKDPVDKKFSSQKEFQDFFLKELLKKRKGVCQDYSILFDRLVKHFGYKADIVIGVTKDAKGKVRRKTGHTWNTVLINGEWKLYDPTWGAGMVKEDKFVPSPNYIWYEVPPSTMLKDHLAFDPMWQLVDSPISLSEFAKDKTQSNEVSDYDYGAYISKYFNSTKVQQAQDALERAELIGKGGLAITKWRKNLQKSLKNMEASNQFEDLKSMTNEVSRIYDEFNAYNRAKSKRFTDKQWTSDYAKEEIPKLKSRLQEINTAFKKIKAPNKKNKANLRKMISSNKKLLNAMGQEIRYLEGL